MSSKSDEKKRQHERWVIPLLMLVFFVTAFIISMSFEKMPPILKRGIQPSDFPQLLLIVLIILTLVMVWFDPVQVRDKLESSVLKTILLMGFFVALTSLDLFLALGAFAAALAVLWGERRGWAVLLVGLIVPASIFFLFDTVFEIRFPRGVLTNLWYG